MKIYLCFTAIAATLLLSACSDTPPSTPAKGALIGGAVGAGGGALVGHELGNTAAGAAVGGVAGAATGAVVGHAEDRNFEETVAEQEEMMRRQEQEMRRQDREIDDLNRQKYWNDSARRFERKAAPPQPEQTENE
jgi:uncharacterized protein YcfJ